MAATAESVWKGSGSTWTGGNISGGGGGGGVSDVTASSPLTSSGGSTPNIALGTVPIGKGGTNATTAASARTSLGVPAGSGTSTGTNTGDQTITLTGDVTGTGTGSFATAIAAGAVTGSAIANSAVSMAKLANIAASTIIGNASGSTGAPSALSAITVAEMLGSEIPTQGSDLTDANVTINIGQGAQRVLPASTLSANRVVTLGVTGSPVTGETICILRRDQQAFTLTVNDDTSAALIVLPASTKFAVYFRFDGSHYALSGAVRIQ